MFQRPNKIHGICIQMYVYCVFTIEAQRRQHKITFVFYILVFYILYFCVLYFVFLCFILSILCFIFCIFVLYFVFLCFKFCIFDIMYFNARNACDITVRCLNLNLKCLNVPTHGLLYIIYIENRSSALARFWIN